MISSDLKAMAPQILAAIRSANNILLHLHPGPDEDSVGSALAMYHVLQGMGKQATIIAGDSELPEKWQVLPGYSLIKKVNFLQLPATDYDLFLIQDASTPMRISNLGAVNIPTAMRTVIIDHHQTNLEFGDINLVLPHYPATAQILYELFREWGIGLTHDVAVCLMVGMNADTGGFIYPLTTPDTFRAAAELAEYAPDYSKYISAIYNSKSKAEIAFDGLALNAVETICAGRVAMASVSYDQLQAKGISDAHVNAGHIAGTLRTVKEWLIGVCLVETAPGVVRVSFRTTHPDKYDVSKITGAFADGGGGHQAAAAGTVRQPLAVAKQYVINTMTNIYPELK